MIVYNIILCLILFGFPLNLAEENAKKGPYKSSVICTETCDKISLPRAKREMITLNVIVSNRTGLLRGNITVAKNNYNYLKIKLNLFLWEDGQWNLHWRVPGWTCDRYIISTFLALSRVKYDKRKCSVSEGFYTFRNLSADFFFHLWMSEAYYGRTMIRVELVDRKTTYYCQQFEMLVTPV